MSSDLKEISSNLYCRYKIDQIQSDLAFDLGKWLKENLVKIMLIVAANFSIIIVFLQIYYLVKESIPAFTEITLSNLLFGDVWKPDTNYSTEPGIYGAFPIILGTLLTTFVAMLIAIPFGVAGAVFISEIAPGKFKRVLKGSIEILAGVPSIIFGAWGVGMLTNAVRITFDVSSGYGWLSASIILAIMSLPSIISVSEDALDMVPHTYREAALGLGSNKWQTISRVVVPAASPGIATAIIIGLARSIGETMAVIMVAGNAKIIPDPLYNVFSPIRTITTTIGLEIGESAQGSTHYHVLLLLGVILFFIIFALNLISESILKRLKIKFTGKEIIKKKNKFTPIIDKIKDYLKITGYLVLIGLFALFIFALTENRLGFFGLIIGLSLILVFNSYYRKISSKQKERTVFIGITIIFGIILLILFLIIGFTIVKGLPYVLKPGFFTNPPSQRGIGPGIVGTMLLVIVSMAIAIPFGILSGIYLAEYAKDTGFTRLVRSAIDILNRTPSVVFGIFGYAFLVIIMGWGISLKAGAVTLALMTLPTIIRTTENAIRSVAHELREGSLALGASKWQTIYKIVLKNAAPAILTGIILAIGRAAGETAPILFTAVYATTGIPTSIDDPVMALPTTVYLFLTNIPNGSGMAYGAALVLLLTVLGFYSLAFFIRKQSQKKFKTVFKY